jgi:hypothetical protein
MRSQVYSFQFLQGIASTTLFRSESHGTREHDSKITEEEEKQNSLLFKFMVT